MFSGGAALRLAIFQGPGGDDVIALDPDSDGSGCNDAGTLYQKESCLITLICLSLVASVCCLSTLLFGMAGLISRRYDEGRCAIIVTRGTLEPVADRAGGLCVAIQAVRIDEP